MTEQKLQDQPREMRDEIYQHIISYHRGNAPPTIAQTNAQFRDEILARFYSTQVFEFRLHDVDGSFEGDESSHIATAKEWCRSIGDEHAGRVRHIDAHLSMVPHIQVSGGGKLHYTIPIDIAWDEDSTMTAELLSHDSGRGRYHYDWSFKPIFIARAEEVNKRAAIESRPSEKLAMVLDIFEGSCFYMS